MFIGIYILKENPLLNLCAGAKANKYNIRVKTKSHNKIYLLAYVYF